jgi:pimeloyl-ACP methyl ester carboxylesterase
MAPDRSGAHHREPDPERFPRPANDGNQIAVERTSQEKQCQNTPQLPCPLSLWRRTGYDSPTVAGEKKGNLPLVFNQHFTGNLDNWDLAVLDGLAEEREVIIFNNAGIASSTGEVPASFAGMAKNAETFIDALGLKEIDLFGFSIGGFVAQQIVIDRTELVHKLVLAGTGPRNLDVGSGQG